MRLAGLAAAREPAGSAEAQEPAGLPARASAGVGRARWCRSRLRGNRRQRAWCRRGGQYRLRRGCCRLRSGRRRRYASGIARQPDVAGCRGGTGSGADDGDGAKERSWRWNRQRDRRRRGQRRGRCGWLRSCRCRGWSGRRVGALAGRGSAGSGPAMVRSSVSGFGSSTGGDDAKDTADCGADWVNRLGSGSMARLPILPRSETPSRGRCCASMIGQAILLASATRSVPGSGNPS